MKILKHLKNKNKNHEQSGICVEGMLKEVAKLYVDYNSKIQAESHAFQTTENNMLLN